MKELKQKGITNGIADVLACNCTMKELKRDRVSGSPNKMRPCNCTMKELKRQIPIETLPLHALVIVP